MNGQIDYFGDYALLELLAESHRSVVFRAAKKESHSTVILKILKREFSSALDLARVKQETKIVQGLLSPGIIRNLGIVQNENSIALILEDTGGISLKEFLSGKPLRYGEFLPVAISLSETLAAIHSQNIIHRDIKPQNIIVNQSNGTITSAKITDFGISTILNEEIREIYNPKTIEGTLPYISPEQTGRMNLSVDYRTDLYSLGVTFYEILSGKFPFSSDDPLTLIHAHIAKEPVLLHELDKSIPVSISGIVQKLLSKSPEDRYQSAYGLKNELEYVRDQLKEKGNVSVFTPGFLDISDRFVMPQKIFGREKEISELMECYSRVTEGQTRIMLVSGVPGIGKSRVVNEIHKPIVKSRGYFISGKYDQLRKDVPFSSILQAFQGLIRQILSESEERIEHWKSSIYNAVGSNAQIIIQVIPEVEIIIGKQPPVPELSPEESQNRFNYCFVNFLKVFSQNYAPLTLFLDDMQWADQPSLNLLRTILSDRTLNHFFLIFSYRDSEMKNSHPFMILVEELKKQNRKINHIHLDSLNSEQVKEFIENLTGKQTKHIYEIGNIVYEKTRGNPFFLNQFIKSMYDEKLVSFVPGSGWEWDFAGMQSKAVTENVVDLMAEKISRLSHPAQELLKLCSCIGNRFSLEQLVSVYRKSYEDTLDILSEAMMEGLIFFSGDVYKFLHDRIQEAAYSLLGFEEKNSLHKKIGEQVLRDSSEEQLYEKIFYITDQLNHARDAIIDEAEKGRLAELNRMAGKKALVSAAYEPAYHYLKSGIELLSGKESWISDYSLTYSLYVSCAEAAYLCLKYEEMEDLSAIVLANSRSIGDKIRIYEVKVKTLIAKYDLKGAVSTGLSILRELNVKFPKKPGAIHALLALIKVRVRMLFKADNLVDIPVIDDPETLAAIRIISSINSAAYWAEPQLLPLLILKVVNLSLKKGNTSYSPYNYAGLGLILSSLGFFRLADQVGKAGITLVEKLNAPDQMPRTHFVYNTFIRPWLSHLRTTLFPLSEAYTNSLHIGDIEFASHSALVYSYYSFLAGVDLEEAYKETEKYSDAASELKQETDLSVLSIYRQVILILTGRESFAGIIKGSVFDENKMLPVYLEKNDRTSLFHLYLNELTLNFFFGNFENAVAYGDKNRETEDGGVSVFALEVFYFYDSLARIAFMRENRISKRAKSKQYSLINKNLKKIRYCAKFAPMNYLHKAQLIEAEIAAASGNVKSAIFLYDKAIRGARENLFIQDEALSFDLAGNFYLNLNLRENARAYLSQARVCYNKWGASALLQRFDVVHSGILPRHERFDQRETIHSDSGNSQTFGSAGLDFSTILKFSHVLSSEIDLNILLDRILTMSMENAGAQKGLLILETKGKLFIEASGRSGSKIQVMESIPLEGSNQAPISIVNYVWKTTENLVLPDAGKTGMFTNDAYIIGNSVKSVICSPIIYKRRLSGILYLENNLTANAFNPERIELLSVLSSQAAISIDNARLISQRADSARFEKEMEITAGIQMSLIPSNPKSKGYEISAYMNPAESVGGDYYDLVNGNEKDWLVIGDVSGHGILSGLIMMMVQTSIHLLLSKKETFSPAGMLKILIEGIEENIRKITRHQYKYMTITILSYDEKGEFTFAGQHQDLLIYRSQSGKIERIETEGIWIGLGNLAEDKDKLIQNKIFRMEQNDILLLYTDGITEGIDENGKEFGVEGLAEILRENGTKTPAEIRNSINSTMKKFKTTDDISFLIMKKSV